MPIQNNTIANQPSQQQPSALDISSDDRRAKESDVTVGGDAVPPETEYFGFALHVGSLFALLLYLLWAALPRGVLYALHIYYYPSRWWALAFPCYLVVALAYTYVALWGYNTEILTKPVSELCTVTDTHARIVTANDTPAPSEYDAGDTLETYSLLQPQLGRTSDDDINHLHNKDNAVLPNQSLPPSARRCNNPSPVARTTLHPPLGDDSKNSTLSTTTNTSTRTSATTTPSTNTYQPLPSFKSPSPHFNSPYMFVPSDGVWDLPLAQVCRLLYSTPDPDDSDGLIMIN